MADQEQTLESRLESIQAVSVGKLPAFLRTVMPVAQQLFAGGLLAVLADQPERVIDAICIGAAVDRQWLDTQGVDVLICLGARVVEVNADFFVRQVLPVLKGADERLAKALANLDPSSPLSAALTTGLQSLQPAASRPAG